mmetsp:Transcript_13278/g.17965  ORF Transcript_13278/g.17965 Transcript_13278/m.17965 type:complete len:121 (+) Transcript_13278:2-364(+)
MDGFLFKQNNTWEVRLKEKRGKYKAYASQVLLALLTHATLAFTGMIAAAMAYQYYAVQIVWIVCVLVGGVEAGLRFYYQSAHPEYVAPGLTYGIMRMGIAWTCVLPTYIICVMRDPHRAI